MYSKTRELQIAHTVSMLPKNLQVVSFDSEWREIYLGTVRKDNFFGLCPNNVPSASKIEVTYAPARDAETVVITSAKWCPLDNCTILVLGSQHGVKLYNWDGNVQIFDYDFKENGIGVDDRLVAGGMARGIVALGDNLVAVGIHTGTILVFEVTTENKEFKCKMVDSQRNHLSPIADLASTSVMTEKNCYRDIMVSGDEDGVLNIWRLSDNKKDGLEHLKVIDSFADSTITTLSLWNRIGKGIILCGCGSGQIRIFSIPSGDIVAEVNAHAGWITGMDLACKSGLMVTCSEDGFVRVWQLSTTGRLISHSSSVSVSDSVMTGVKFLDQQGASFAVTAYDSDKIQFYGSRV